MLRMVTWGDMIERWQKDPNKLYSEIITLLWQAGIKPNESYSQLNNEGKKQIILAGDDSKEDVELSMEFNIVRHHLNLIKYHELKGEELSKDQIIKILCDDYLKRNKIKKVPDVPPLQ